MVRLEMVIKGDVMSCNCCKTVQKPSSPVSLCGTLYNHRGFATSLLLYRTLLPVPSLHTCLHTLQTFLMKLSAENMLFHQLSPSLV